METLITPTEKNKCFFLKVVHKGETFKQLTQEHPETWISQALNLYMIDSLEQCSSLTYSLCLLSALHLNCTTFTHHPEARKHMLVCETQ